MNKPFCCPICEHDKFKAITEGNGILGPGHSEWVIEYECKGCSVRFKDPEKFTKDRND